jgi:hypothetical protein
MFFISLMRAQIRLQIHREPSHQMLLSVGTFLSIPILILLLTLVSSVTSAGAEDCPISSPDSFLPKDQRTVAPTNALPAPSSDNDCAFYNWAWQSFLFVTQRKSNGNPAFLNFPTIESAFPKAYEKSASGSPVPTRSPIVPNLSVRNIEPILNEDRRKLRPEAALDDGISQASQGGEGAILVDQNNSPIFYSINVNDTFADFVRANGLDDVKRLLLNPAVEEDRKKGAIPAELEFRPGSMELKSSWMIIQGPVSHYSNYIVTKASVPVLKNETDSTSKATHVVVDTAQPPRIVNVALLGLHVVGVIDGHPEFVWATFEHADGSGHRDIAPAATENPNGTGLQTIGNAASSYPLFQKNTSSDHANVRALQPIGPNQKFSQATSIYRIFPGSQSEKPADGESAAPWEDPSVFNINKHIGELFDSRDPSKKDWRRNYRLVGAVWIDQPRGMMVGTDAKTLQNFKEDTSFDDGDKRLAGENRLSNMSMESFTQPAGTGAPHCFTCHDTTQQNQLPPGKVLWPRRINVSHIFTIVVKHYLSQNP